MVTKCKFFIVLFLLFLTTASVKAFVVVSDTILLEFLAEAGAPITCDNVIKLLPSGKEKFDDMFAELRKARHHIHMEYFNFRNDSIATELFTILAHKAMEGVEVRLLFDAFGNASNNQPLKKKHLKAIRKSGIEIVKFDPINFPYINHVFHRDHRKIVVIDGQVAYTGGMNVADYYIEGLPEIGPWRDMHMRIEGGAVQDLQDIFLIIWNKQTEQNIDGEVYYPHPREFGEVTVAIVDREPKVSPKLLRRTFVESIRAAEHSIQIVNPYFVPTRSIKKELKKALKRGVHVEIMISSKSDIGFTPDAGFHIARQLMKKGAEVYMYDAGFHHSKIMMIDDAFCTVGSANLDSRSLRYDYETNAFIFDEGVTAELTDMFEADKEHSTVMTDEYWKSRSRWKRFVGWFAHLFTPVL